MDDLIWRHDAIDAFMDEVESYGLMDDDGNVESGAKDSDVIEMLKNLPPANPWIPCSEGLPKDTKPVIVTWKNTDPASYYQYIVGKHFTGTACYKNGKWYWYSNTTEDMLAEYGRYDSEEFDEAIECIAWMHLPEPWKEENDERIQ